jgi:hypothetical protein
VSRDKFRGDIPDAHFQIGRGQLKVQKLDVFQGQNKLKVLALTGTVGLPRDGSLNLFAAIPRELLETLVHDKNVLQFLPNQLDFPITGTKLAPRVALDKTLQKALDQAGGNFLGDLLSGHKKRQPASNPGE